MKNILLIFPGDRFKEFSSLRPPLGLTYIGAVLEEEGYNVKIIDFGVEKEDVNILNNDYLKSFDLVGISVLSSLYNNSKEIIKQIRSVNKDIPIIMGGTHPTAMPREVLEENDINIVVMGEGEETIKEIVKNYPRNLKKIKGIVYKNKGKIIENERRPLIPDINILPFPARHLLKIEKYQNYIHGRKATTIMSSRGCPYNCVYCFKLDGRAWRPRKAELVVDELEKIVKDYNISAFYFHDDLFTADRKRVIDICNEIIKRNLDIFWICESRINTIDEELLNMMKKAGCKQIHFGIESGDEETLKKIRKGITKEQAKKALSLTKKAKIYTKAYFMIGFPRDTRESLVNSLNFMLDIEADEILLNVVTPFPGTELWDLAIKDGIINPKNIPWDKFYGATPDVTEQFFFTNNLTREELIKIKKFMYRKIIINRLFKKLYAGEFKYIYNLIKEKKDVGLFKFLKSVFWER